MSMLEHIHDAIPHLSEALSEFVTGDHVLDWFRTVADTPAPSQTSSALRGRAIQESLASTGSLPPSAYRADVFSTGSDMITHGTGGTRFVAHLDEISYVTAGPRDDDGWPLIAYCYHLADGPRPARVIRWSDDRDYHVADEGLVVGTEASLRYRSSADFALQSGDRIALWSPVELETGTTRLTGAIDNAAGVAASLAAAETLARADIPFSLLLPDEEEGPAGCSSSTISRGAARTFPHVDPAPLTVVVDTQGLGADDLAATDDHRRAFGATLAEYSSQTRGGVTPPPLYSGLTALSRELTAEGTPFRPTTGYVPRSDDAMAQLFTRDIALVGYPGINRHFDHGLPATNLDDLVSLGRTLVFAAAASHLGLLPGVRARA